MKRVVLMVVDGLRADLVCEEFVPHLNALAERSRRYDAHRAAFPTATRVNSASLATGCHPARHGLLGNAIAIDEGDGLVAVSVGPAGFRERWRRATGATLNVPTLSERLAPHGGAIIHSNSSAGAAHMQDPDGFGTLFHRDGSHAPGLVPIEDERHPRVGYDGDGDRAVTAMFCESLQSTFAALNVLWICEPDHSQHVLELGSPEHRAVLSGADGCVAQVVDCVERLRTLDQDVLLIVCSDHGHETVSEIVPVHDHMIAAGFIDEGSSHDVVLASSGMSALVYLSPNASHREADIVAWLSAQPWCAHVFNGPSLNDVGLCNRDGLAIAFAMASDSAQCNRFGIPGVGAVAADPFMSSDAPGRGQHGGLGRYETNPFLIVSHTSLATGRYREPSSAVDVAPTVLNFLNIPVQRLDGRALLG